MSEIQKWWMGLAKELQKDRVRKINYNKISRKKSTVHSRNENKIVHCISRV